MCASAARASDFYVSAKGSRQGDGSMGSPWDLQTALNQPAAVQPGDTVWLRAGAYVVPNGGWFYNLKGTAQSPVNDVRGWCGERVG